MTQEAVVTKLLPDGMAEVAVRRTTACGGNCGSCESCAFERKLKIAAKNSIDAQPGQKVLLKSKSAIIFGVALRVYVLPMLFFLAGYLFAALVGLGETGCIAVSFIFLLAAGAYLVFSQRRKKQKNEINFEIISFL